MNIVITKNLKINIFIFINVLVMAVVLFVPIIWFVKIMLYIGIWFFLRKEGVNMLVETMDSKKIDVNNNTPTHCSVCGTEDKLLINGICLKCKKETSKLIKEDVCFCGFCKCHEIDTKTEGVFVYDYDVEKYRFYCNEKEKTFALKKQREYLDLKDRKRRRKR